MHRGPRWMRRLPLALLALPLGGPLWAHPMGATIPSHQLRLTLRGRALTLDYSVRLPTRWIIAEIGQREGFTPQDGDAFTAGKLRELASNLRVSVDGEPLALALAPPEEPTGLGDNKFLVYALSLTGEIPAGDRHELHLTQSNYPEEHAFFMTEVLLDPLARVESCSLFRIEDGRARFSRYGQWRMEEEQRELRLAWSWPSGALARLARSAATEGDAPQPATELVATGELERLAAGQVSRRAGLVLGAGFALLGLAAARAGRTPWTWIAAAVDLALGARVAGSIGLAFAAALVGGAGAGVVWRWLDGRDRAPSAALALAGALGLALVGLLALGA